MEPAASSSPGETGRRNHLYINYGTFQDFLEKSVDWQIRQRGVYEDVGRVVSMYAFAKKPGSHELAENHQIVNVPIPKCPVRTFTSYAGFVRQVFRRIRDEEFSRIWIQCHIYFIPLLICLRLFARGRALVGIGLRADLDLAFRLGGARESEVFLGSRALARALERFLFCRLCDFVFPRSENIAAVLAAQGVPSRKIVVQRFELPPGVDPTAPAPDENFRRTWIPFPDASAVYSFVGRMTHYNFVFDAVDLFEKILKDDPKAVLVMAGRGPEEERVRRRLAEKNLAGRVSMPGFIRREDVLKLRQISDFSLCLMGGNSLLEAAAMGSIVVAYDIDWHRELVTHLQNGIVVPEGRVDELYAAICAVRADPSNRRKFLDRTWEVIRKKYSQKRRSIFAELETAG